MALNIKNSTVERLASEVARLAGETKTEAIRRALEERKARLTLRLVRRDRRQTIVDVLEREIWPDVPKRLLGRRLSRRSEAAILGYGPRGV